VWFHAVRSGTQEVFCSATTYPACYALAVRLNQRHLNFWITNEPRRLGPWPTTVRGRIGDRRARVAAVLLRRRGDVYERLNGHRDLTIFNYRGVRVYVWKLKRRLNHGDT
jgi:hypothetical protein